MCKKIISLVIIFNIIFLNFSYVYADDIDEELDDEVIEVANQVDDDNLILNSRIAVAYDRKSGKVIWGKNETKRSAMASTTKIMTAIVLIENSDLSQTVNVSSKAAGTGGSRLGLKTGDSITLNDLLYGLMLKSGNDAAVAIAETVGGSVEGFAELMNNKAADLGLENTHFVTPHGLDNPEHYTTAVELAKIADYALKNKTFANVVGTKNYTVTINGYQKNISNTNELLGNLDGVYGVKTGFTNNAGRCLVTSVNRNDFDIITVVLQADTKKFRTSDSIKLIEYVYNNYELVNVKEIVDEKFKDWCVINLNRISINKAKKQNINVYITDLKNDIIPVLKNKEDKIDIEVSSLFYLEAPVEEEKIIGNLKVILDGETVDIVEIRNAEYIEKNSMIDYVKMFLELVHT